MHLQGSLGNVLCLHVYIYVNVIVITVICSLHIKVVQLPNIRSSVYIGQGDACRILEPTPQTDNSTLNCNK